MYKKFVIMGTLVVAAAASTSGAAQEPGQPSPAAPPAKSDFASLDPATLASKIINDAGAPNVNGASAKLIDDPKVMGGKALRVQVKGKGKNPWDTNVSTAVNKPVKAGDTLLLVFQARLEQGEKGATSTTLPWNSVSLTSPPWSAVAGASAEIGPEWKLVEIKGKADKDFAPGSLSAGIQLATARQTVDLGPIVLLDLGPGK
jgi:hypothetical protein